MIWLADPSLRLRPVPEMECCLAYLPPQNAPRRPPTIHGLNVTSWFVLSLCDGQDDQSLRQEFSDVLAQCTGDGTRAGTLLDALAQLHGLGLIHRTEQERTP